jgi:EmrB/QacA subfamily drug resistance transporter
MRSSAKLPAADYAGNRKLVTLGLMIGSFMGSMESTVVATAMPTIVGQLGGLSFYGWAFSIYVLASSAGMPVTGKLSDIFGRRIVYAWSMALFLLASALCAFAPSMFWLIVFRAMQGLGAAGLLPLALIMIGDMFTFEERARVQGLFSAVWGISSIAGPLIGGILVDRVGWPSVFYVNIPFGFVSAWLVWHYWVDYHERSSAKPHIDYAGAAAVSGSAVLLLLALVDIVSWQGAGLLVAALVLAWLAYKIEKRSPDPILPLPLFSWKLFTISILHALVIGWVLNGVTAYLPLFVQEVQKRSATEAGASLTPLLLAWVISSVICAKLMLRFGYRLPAIGGMCGVIAGSALLILLRADSPKALLIASMLVMGSGFGFTVPALLIAVQTTVERKSMGSATSMIQFARSMGGSIGVGVMGAYLNWQSARSGFGPALQGAFVVAAAITILGLFITLAAPILSPQQMGKSAAPAESVPNS